MKTIARVKVEGLRELEATFRDLPKNVARNALRRVLERRAEPMVDTMQALAPDDPATPETSDLKGSVAAGTKLSKRQGRLHRKEARDDKQFAEIFVGAGPRPHAHLQEFGTARHGPHAFARPAWDKHHAALLDGIKDDLWKELAKAAKRHAGRIARIAGKG